MKRADRTKMKLAARVIRAKLLDRARERKQWIKVRTAETMLRGMDPKSAKALATEAWRNGESALVQYPMTINIGDGK